MLNIGIVKNTTLCKAKQTQIESKIHTQNDKQKEHENNFDINSFPVTCINSTTPHFVKSRIMNVAKRATNITQIK